MSVLSLSYWESDVYWRQNNKQLAELVPTKWQKTADMKKLRHCHPMYTLYNRHILRDGRIWGRDGRDGWSFVEGLPRGWVGLSVLRREISALVGWLGPQLYPSFCHVGCVLSTLLYIYRPIWMNKWMSLVELQLVRFFLCKLVTKRVKIFITI